VCAGDLPILPLHLPHLSGQSDAGLHRGQIRLHRLSHEGLLSKYYLEEVNNQTILEYIPINEVSRTRPFFKDVSTRLADNSRH
jgi:hypothetical protein